MITAQELRKLARERNLPLDLIEKDYALGWIIIGITTTKQGSKLIFKGGTSLSKVHFPSQWRLSEDLDYTLPPEMELTHVNTILTELPDAVKKTSGLTLTFRDAPYTNPTFLRARGQFDGPISRNTIKIEASKEKFIGDTDTIRVSRTYDYPEYSILAYTLNNILAEKLRAIIERGAVRDYYDAWRLFNTGKTDTKRTRELFLMKCEGKGVPFTGTGQFIPEDTARRLEPYLRSHLTRLSPKPLPPITQILDELKADIINTFN